MKIRTIINNHWVVIRLLSNNALTSSLLLLSSVPSSVSCAKTSVRNFSSSFKWKKQVQIRNTLYYASSVHYIQLNV